MKDFIDLEMFSPLTDEEKEQLVKSAVEKSCKKGQEIIRFGADVQHIYVLTWGQVKLHRTEEDGQDIILQILDAPEWFFDMAAFFKVRAPTSVTALENCTFTMLPSEIVRGFMYDNRGFADKILHHISTDFDYLASKVSSIALRSPEQRVCYFFLKQAIKRGKSKTEFELPYKKSLIANELGMTAETFSRVLARLKTKGVKIEKNTVRLPKLGVLCQACHLDLAKDCPVYGEEDCVMHDGDCDYRCQ